MTQTHTHTPSAFPETHVKLIPNSEITCRCWESNCAARTGALNSTESPKKDVPVGKTVRVSFPLRPLYQCVYKWSLLSHKLTLTALRAQKQPRKRYAGASISEEESQGSTLKRMVACVVESLTVLGSLVESLFVITSPY